MAEGKILVIDDEIAVRRFLARVLQDYQVELAAGGREGLEWAAKDHFDVALVDIGLPDLDGMEVLRTLQERDEDLKTLIVTAYPALETAIQAVRLGAFDYLLKPLENQKVLISVQNALTARHLALTNQELLRDLQRANVDLESRIEERTAELTNANGELQGEIAERKQAEEALQGSHRQLESRERFITRIMESIPSSLLVIDRSLRVVSANPNFLEKSRRRAQTTLGRELGEVFPKALVEYTRLDEKVHTVFRTGEPVEGGNLAYRAPGLSTRVYFYRLIPLKVGEAVGNVMVLMDDVTEREQLAEEVRLAERHLASVVECANDLVVSMDPQGLIVTWNRAAEMISGLTAEEVNRQPLVSLCTAEQQPAMSEMLQRLADGEDIPPAVADGPGTTEVDLLTADGHEVPIAWACSRMLDDEGQIIGLVAVGRDLTERRQLEIQLIQTAKMASLGGMAGGIAHELRNPLGIISAGAQLLLERPDDAGLRTECAEKIQTASRRASLIIENLLRFARPGGERRREVDLNSVLGQTLALLAHQMALQQITVRKELQADLPKVYGNSDLLQQVFANMILNARNAMPEGGTLTVTTRVVTGGEASSRGSARRVEIRFQDTGHGIPPKNLPKIFDPFFTTMPVGSGVGLGLSISYSIVQQHQGTIGVESQMGQGTTFTVRLPVNNSQ